MKKLIGVYGTLKKGYGNHRVMEASGGVFVTDAYIPYNRFRSAGIPFLDFKGATGDLYCKVEVYEVETVEPLDRLEGHPRFYERLPITTTDGLEIESYHHPVDNDESELWLQGPDENFDGLYIDWNRS